MSAERPSTRPRVARAAFALALAAVAPAAQDASTAAPADAPAEPPVSVHAEGALEGYTLFAPLRSRTTYLVDMQGEVVHTWESEHPPGQSVYLTDEGHLFRAARAEHDRFHGGGQGGRLQEFTWDGELVWDVVLSNETHHAHHDYELLPNGNVLVLAWEYMSADDALAAGRRPEELDPEAGFWPDAIFELRPVRPDGFEVVWSWHARDHLVQDLYPDRANHGEVFDNPGRLDLNFDVRDGKPLSAAERAAEAELAERMRALGYAGEAPGGDADGERDRRRTSDWMHSNGIDYHAGYDLILVSSRSLSEVFVLDHSTTTEEAAGSTGGRWGQGGDLLYRWGNPQHYGCGDEIDRTLFVQHDATWLDTDDGSLRFLVYDNGQGRAGGEDYSEVEEVVLPFDPERGFLREPGLAFGPTEPAWRYDGGEQRFYSPFVSGAQRLPNGNTLVCVGAEGRLLEVTHDGQLVWEYRNPFGGEVSLMAGRRGDGPGPGGGPPPRPRRAGAPDPDGPPRPDGAGSPPPGGPGGGRDGGDDRARTGLFRATRLPADHPALVRHLMPSDGR